MAIPKFTDDLTVISKLSDNPNSEDGLSAAELKARFDAAPLAIQKFINETLIPEMDKTVDVAALLNGILDKTLKESGKAAEAEATGKTIAEVLEVVKSIEPGASEEQIAQIQKNADDIAALPLTVTDDGYTDISGLRRVTGAAIHEGADKATVTLTLEGGAEESYEILWDENGYPAKITRKDGSVCALSWTADAPEEEDFDGVLFDGGSAVTWLDGSGAEVSGASLSGSASVVSAYGDYFYTEEMIDLTDFSRLKVRFTAANDNNTFAVSKTVSTLAADFAASKVITAAGEAELDISALTGDYYILVLSGTPMTGSTSTFTADKVWLE